MNFLQIMQIANMGIGALVEIKSKPKSGSSPLTKDDIKAYILTSTSATEALGHLSISDRKKFNKGVDKMAEAITLMDANSEWK